MQQNVLGIKTTFGTIAANWDDSYIDLFTIIHERKYPVTEAMAMAESLFTYIWFITWSRYAFLNL